MLIFNYDYDHALLTILDFEKTPYRDLRLLSSTAANNASP